MTASPCLERFSQRRPWTYGAVRQLAYVALWPQRIEMINPISTGLVTTLYWAAAAAQINSSAGGQCFIVKYGCWWKKDRWIRPKIHEAGKKETQKQEEHFCWWRKVSAGGGWHGSLWVRLLPASGPPQAPDSHWQGPHSRAAVLWYVWIIQPPRPISQCSKVIASPLVSAEIIEINKSTQTLTRRQTGAAMFDLHGYWGGKDSIHERLWCGKRGGVSEVWHAAPSKSGFGWSDSTNWEWKTVSDWKWVESVHKGWSNNVVSIKSAAVIEII